ncbi:zinc metallopeptidase [Lutimonas zeaxanthinifaciens]|uniref:zinc metallopeptidase n=1 Tax=Lutimonas zeaxanthinifaciens TaxID=3060215 RepID=UPI00265CF4C3|nr:zinc metallopeptidase [Lutimonas sp. YSD2104]WKK65776.1 zinc metallopeptidase [Lutimonas sp. YSD2104]
MSGSFLLIIVIGLLGMLVQGRLKSKFKKYSNLRLRNGMSGREIAEKMLADNGIYDVQVISTPGRLTDHYNPQNKTVNLSEAVYSERNAAAAAVAAHECGHAVQHAKSYAWLQLRSKLVPAVGISSKLASFLLIGGIFTVEVFPQLLLLGILLFASTVVFTIVTLPVEYDASNRALAWLEDKQIVTNEEHDASKDALKWAARTYVVAALSSIATLLYYVNIYNSRS